MSRIDVSDYLVHFTKEPDTIETFESIVTSGTLRGGTGFIKGNYRCVCFTESPLHALQDILLRSDENGFKYSPFGIVVRKKWLFEQGGRPVIYQPDSEFGDLPDSMKWRHVRYEPHASPPVDFTWEREWRIHANELAIAPENAWLVVPSVDALRQVCEEHHMASETPLGLYEHLDDFMILDALIANRWWTSFLLSNPECGWSGLDVDLE